MFNLGKIAIHAAIVFILFFQSQNANAQSATPADIAGPGINDVQRQASRVADIYTKSITKGPKNREFLQVYRATLNASYRDTLTQSPDALAEYRQRATQAIIGGTPVGETPNPLKDVIAPPPAPSLLDIDPRYQRNFFALTGNSSLRDRIWGGLPTSLYLNTVVIVGGTNLCTGTVIGKRAVLTAQHCHCGGVTATVYVGKTLDDSQPGYRIERSVPMKPCGSPVGDAADVALMFVDHDFDAAVVPVKLATSAQINQAQFMRAVGFGRTEAGTVGQKMMVDLPVATPDCQGSVSATIGTKSDAAYYQCIAGIELVAGAPALNKDTCNGDSGGPLFVSDGNNGQVLAAATSRAVGVPGARRCGDGGIYVRVDGPIGAWIASQGI